MHTQSLVAACGKGQEHLGLVDCWVEQFARLPVHGNWLRYRKPFCSGRAHCKTVHHTHLL